MENLTINEPIDYYLQILLNNFEHYSRHFKQPNSQKLWTIAKTPGFLSEAQPMLFYGPPGSLNREYAQTLIITTFGVTSEDIEKKLHTHEEEGFSYMLCPYFVEIDFQHIAKNQQQGLIQWLTQRIQQGHIQHKRHVILMHNIDRMEWKTAQAFRRMMEIHHRNAWFVMTAQDPSTIHNAIESRTQGFRCPVPTTKELAALHKDMQRSFPELKDKSPPDATKQKRTDPYVHLLRLAQKPKLCTPPDPLEDDIDEFLTSCSKVRTTGSLAKNTREAVQKWLLWELDHGCLLKKILHQTMLRATNEKKYQLTQVAAEIDARLAKCPNQPMFFYEAAIYEFLDILRTTRKVPDKKLTK